MVSEQDLTHACLHMPVVGSLMQQTTGESLPQTISQVLEMVLDLNKRCEWMERARLLLRYDHVPLCPRHLLDY